MMRKIVLLQPQRLVFGRDCAGDCAPHLRRAGLKRAFLVTGPPTRRLAELLAETLRQAGLQAEIFDGVDREPTIAMFRVALDTARAAQPNVVIGIGGGSSLDVAKLGMRSGGPSGNAGEGQNSTQYLGSSYV